MPYKNLAPLHITIKFDVAERAGTIYRYITAEAFVYEGITSHSSTVKLMRNCEEFQLEKTSMEQRVTVSQLRVD
jgi:hypothetical protein